VPVAKPSYSPNPFADLFASLLSPHYSAAPAYYSPFESLLLPSHVPAAARPSVLALDVHELPTSYEVKVDVPGVQSPEEITLEVDADERTLTITTERSIEEEAGSQGQPRRYERYYGLSHRTVRLPRNTDPANVTAAVNHGVLTISVQKTSGSVSPSSKIPIAFAEKEAEAKPAVTRRVTEADADAQPEL